MGVLAGDPWVPRRRVSRTRTFGARSRNNCSCIWAVAILGFAKAKDGASASNNAMEILSLISNLFRLHSNVLYRTCSTRVRIQNLGPGSTQNKLPGHTTNEGNNCSMGQIPARCHQNFPLGYTNFQCHQMQATLIASVLVLAILWP